MTARRPSALALIIAVMIVWGSTFVVTKVAVEEVPPLALAALRFLIAALVLLPILVARGWWRGLPRPLPLATLALMAFTGIAAFTAAFNFALIHASASQGALIFALVPAAVAIAAVIFLKEAPSRRRLAGIALSVGGVALVVAASEKGGASPDPVQGALWMLAAVVLWAAYTVFAKRLAGADQIVVTAWISLLGMAMLIPPAALELARSPWPAPSWQGWLGVLFLGVIASAAAYIAYNYALRALDASLVGAFLNLDPIVGVLTAALFLGETLRDWQMAGGLIALVGMWLASSQAAEVVAPKT